MQLLVAICHLQVIRIGRHIFYNQQVIMAADPVEKLKVTAATREEQTQPASREPVPARPVLT
jgi:hypothetical protein